MDVGDLWGLVKDEVASPVVGFVLVSLVTRVEELEAAAVDADSVTQP